MKKTLLLLTLTLIAALPAFADVKVATVDMAKIFENYGRAKTAQATIDAELKKLASETAQRQAEGRALMAQIEALGQKYNNPALSQTARDDAKKQARDLEDRIESKKEDFDKFQAQSRQALAQKEQTQREFIYNEIQRAATAVARQQGASIVLNVSEKTAVGLPVVIYSNSQWDITSAVIASLNAGAN